MSLYGALAEAERTGKEVLVGEVDLEGSNPTTVSTGFANVDAVLLQIEGSSAPTTTLIESDGTETVSYVIIGRRR